MHTDTGEVDRNFDAFLRQLPDIVRDHHGQYALMHDQAIVTYCKDSLSAVMEGAHRFGQGCFSVQEVTAERDNLGFYSYAGGAGQG